MKTKTLINLAAVAALTALAACSPKPTADSSSASAESPAAMAEMSGMAGMSDMSGMAMDAAAKTGKGVGEITSIDERAGTVTIKHEAIPEVSWPAMTMAFKANPSSLLTGLKVGEKVSFDVSVKGSDAEVTSIQAK